MELLGVRDCGSCVQKEFIDQFARTRQLLLEGLFCWCCHLHKFMILLAARTSGKLKQARRLFCSAESSFRVVHTQVSRLSLKQLLSGARGKAGKTCVAFFGFAVGGGEFLMHCLRVSLWQRDSHLSVEDACVGDPLKAVSCAGQVITYKQRAGLAQSSVTSHSLLYTTHEYMQYMLYSTVLMSSVLSHSLLHSTH